MSEVGRRSLLMSLLSEACEIEHGLSCCYLYAAFSLKYGQVEGLSFAQEQKVRRWAAQLSFVATQEMLHLAQAWNLLQSVGGTPYHSHPYFPLERGALPVPVKMSLEGYSLATLRRFRSWERPAELRRLRAAAEEPYTTVGALYDAIEKVILSIPEASLFVADPALQIGPDVVEFPDLVRVRDHASACAAIERVRAQGEGSAFDREDCHYGVFSELEAALVEELRLDPTFQPAVLVVDNPARRTRRDATLVRESIALQAMALFDDIYGLAIRMLAWVFASAHPAAPLTGAFARFAIGVMPAVLRPLGQLIMRLPSGVDARGAGPSFSLARHVPLPERGDVARCVAVERVAELASDLEALSVSSGMAQLRGFSTTLRSFLASFDA
jgi:hypothetical protein